jgi:hypothetical protein
MNISLLLYKDVVQIPTSYAIQRGFYFKYTPLQSVPVEQTERLRDAIRTAIERGNPSISRDEVTAISGSKNPPMLAATGARSWHALDRQTKGSWSIKESNSAYEIRVNEPMQQPRGWHEDKTKRVQFPAGTPVEDVIDRLITMIQERARE